MIPVDAALVAPAPAPASAAAPPMASSDARARIEDQLAMLTRLAQVGMAIAEDCGRQVAHAASHAGQPADPEAPAPPAPRHDPGLVFARVARAVRMTIALQSRLAKDLDEFDKAQARAEDWRRFDRRQRLSRQVREAAHVLVTTRREAEQGASDDPWSEFPAETEIEKMSAVAYERLVDAEDGRLLGRPFDEVVAQICRDLGMTPDRTARLLASLEAPPGEGLADQGTAPAAARPPDADADPDPDPNPDPDPGPGPDDPPPPLPAWTLPAWTGPAWTGPSWNGPAWTRSPAPPHPPP